jgi:hypothetical protein
MDWIEKANKVLENEGCEELEIFFNKYTDPITKEKFIKDYVIDAMIEFAKLACEQQKKLCAENVLVLNECETEEGKENYTAPFFIDSNLYEINRYGVDKESILNTPTVNFNDR